VLEAFWIIIGEHSLFGLKSDRAHTNSACLPYVSAFRTEVASYTSVVGLRDLFGLIVGGLSPIGLKVC
jgi:hypothetical protein